MGAEHNPSYEFPEAPSRPGSGVAPGSAVGGWRTEWKYNQQTVPQLTYSRTQPTSSVTHGVRVTTQHSHAPATVTPAPTAHARSTHGGISSGRGGSGFQSGPIPDAIKNVPIQQVMRADHGQSRSNQ